MKKRVDIITAAGDRYRGYASTDHAASSYGRPVILVNGIPHVPTDSVMVGAHLVVDNADVVECLNAAGFAASLPQPAKTIGARLPDDLYAKLEARAKAKGITKSAAIIHAVTAWLGEE